MRTRTIVLVSISALLLSGAMAARGATRHGPKAPRHGPRIESGHYVSADGHVTLDVDVPDRRALFHFTLLCREPFGNQYVTPGPAPKAIHLPGNRVGTVLVGDGEYGGPSESGFPGEQLTFWGLHGHFAGPTSFRGRVGFETGTFPVPPAGSTPPPLARPECLGRARISLLREP
jgi:hypothetical protein